MATPAVDRLKVWLGNTDLRQKNFALYQLLNALIDAVRSGQLNLQAISGSSSGSGNAITSLIGDVVAAGPGIATATIQPNVVTYAKIQQTVGADVLIGRGDTPGNVEEINLGDNLAIVDGQLRIVTPEGTYGFAHPLLSLSHSDTIPFSPPEPGDMIVAFENTTPEQEAYINGFILGLTTEDFEGVYAGMVLGMPGSLIAPNGGAYSAQPFSYVTPELDDYQIRLVPDIIDGFIQAPLVEDFEGIRDGYTALVPGGSEPGPGNYGAYTPPLLEFVEPPDPEPEITGLWYRIARGTAGQYLRIAAGTPQWLDPVRTIAISSVGTVDNLDISGSQVVYLDNATDLILTGFTKGPIVPFGFDGNFSDPYDGEKVTFISRGAGNVYFANANTGSFVGNRFTNWITSGHTPIAAGYGRATYTYDATNTVWRLTEHQQGGMITIPFNAALFTASVGLWTVDAGDVPEDAAYYISGKTIRLQLRAITTTTSLATGSLFYALPNGWTAARRTNTIGFGIVAAALESLVTFVSAAGATVISFSRYAGNFPAETNTLGAICNIEFDIN